MLEDYSQNERVAFLLFLLKGLKPVLWSNLGAKEEELVLP